jgi:hypothetical protein
MKNGELQTADDSPANQRVSRIVRGNRGRVVAACDLSDGSLENHEIVTVLKADENVIRRDA